MLVVAVLAGAGAVAAGCAKTVSPSAGGTGSSPQASSPTSPSSPSISSGTTPSPVESCLLTGGASNSSGVPVDQVCSSAGAPHFATPDDAMTYLASAWNANDVQEIDYVTDPAGREQMDSMASAMQNLQFKSCSENPAGDYTCYFMHDILPSASPYPNPQGFPPGEAVFTVAPAGGPGWYLTQVEHCG